VIRTDLISASRIWPTARNKHYTDPEAMVAAPKLERLFWQRQTTTGQVTVIHHSPTRPDQFPLHSFPYAVESPALQVTGQVRFRPLQPLDLTRTVEDDTWVQPGRSFEPVEFAFPNDSTYKGLSEVGFDAPSGSASESNSDLLGD